MTIYGLNMDGLGVDSRPAKLRRALFGALYGLLGGVTFVLMAAFIDQLLNPDLPLGVNWSAFWLRLPLIGLGLALVGAVTCWWHEAWQGLLSGAIAAAALTLFAALFTAQVGTGMKFIVLLFILVPVAAMTLPVAYFLRWLTERHARAMQAGWGQVARLIVLTVVVGAGAGYFMRSVRGAEATRFIHEYLQNPAAESNPLVKVAGVAERPDMSYVLYATTSFESTVGFDIHITYEDGYQILCEVILYPSRNPFLDGCAPEE